jgi:hypothetical protein
MGLFGGALYLSLPNIRGMESPAIKSGGPSVAARTLRFYWPAPQEAVAKGQTQEGVDPCGGGRCLQVET